MNEPVAHRFKWEEQKEWQYGDGYDATGAPNDPDYFAYEPLYTHPADLTDEEILEVFVENYGDDILPNIQASGIEFARAILRKAQQK